MPPEHTEPLAEARLGPLTLQPPPGSELRVVAGGRYRTPYAGNLTAKNTQSSAPVTVRRDYENACDLFMFHAPRHVARFLLGRKALNRTDLNRRRFRKIVNVSRRQVYLGEFIDPRLGWNIDQDSTAVPPPQELKRTN